MGRRNAENNDRRTEQFRKLFIGGLTPQTDEIRLKKYYEQWGELVDFVVMKDNKTCRSRGFGFVTYRDPEMVDEAQNNRPHEIDGKIVEAKRAMPREDSNTPESHMTVNKLFVGGLKKDVTTEDLRKYFGNYGAVTECEIVVWKDSGESRGFGFVTFDDYDPVDKAILYKPHQIASSRADVKKALSKDEIEEIRRKQQTDSVSVSSTSSNDYFSSQQGKSSAPLPQFSTNAPQPTYTSSSMPYMGNIIYDSTFQNSFQYPMTGSNWNTSATLGANYYYTRSVADVGQYLTPSLINFGSPVSNIQSESNESMENRNFKSSSVTEGDCGVQMM